MDENNSNLRGGLPLPPGWTPGPKGSESAAAYRWAGFTLMELILVLVIAGLLTTYAADRFAAPSVLPTVERVKSKIRYTQINTVNTRQVFGIQCQNAQLGILDEDGNPVSSFGGEEFPIDLTRDHVEAITDFTLYFDEWGTPYTGVPSASTILGADLTILINTSHSFQVIAGTGYVK